MKPFIPLPDGVKSAHKQLTSAMLTLQALGVGFAALTLFGLRVLPPAVLWGAVGGYALALLLAARFGGSQFGDWLGSILQAPIVVITVVVAFESTWLAVFFGVVSAIFVGMWVAAVRVGHRVDRDRAAYHVANPET